jgi:hypothetical protein
MERSITSYALVSGISAVAIHSIATGAGVGDRESDPKNRAQLVNGTATHFMVQALDTHGNLREESDDNVTFELEVLSAYDGSSIFHASKEGGFVSDVVITDQGNGSYVCSYTPRVEGDCNMHVRINGLPVKDSPFPVHILPANRTIVFVDLSSQLNHGARLERGNAVARQNLQVKTHRVAISKEALPIDRPSWFKFKINLLHGSSTGRSGNSGWVFLGITSHTQPKETSHRDHTSYGWAGHGQVWESGVDHNGEQGWKGFAAGDLPVFMYDPVGGHLAMMNHTLLHTMTVGPSPPTGYFVHANLLGAGDCVEIVTPTEADRTFLQQNLRILQKTGTAGIKNEANQISRTVRSRTIGSNGSLGGSSYDDAGSPGTIGTSPLGASPSSRRDFPSGGSIVNGSPRNGGSPTKRNSRTIIRPKTLPGGF